MRSKLLAILFMFASCAGTKEALKNGGTTFINCAKADIGRTIPELGSTILSAVAQILAAGSDNYVAKLDEIGTKYGNDAEACAVSSVVTVIASLNSNGTNAPIHVESPIIVRAIAVINAKSWEFEAH